MLIVETFGLYGLIIGVIAIMQAFISSGIRVTLQRHLAILFEKSETFEFFKLLRKSLLVFCLISMVLGLFLYSDLGRLNSETYVKIQPYLLNIFIISCLTAFVYILADVFRCIRQVNKFIFFREFTVAILFLLLIIVLWFLDFVSLDWVLFVFSLALVGTIIWGVYSFRNLDLKQFKYISFAKAINHPTWKMGYKNSIDSATMANKCLEIIEAKYLFDIPFEKIDIIIHNLGGSLGVKDPFSSSSKWLKVWNNNLGYSIDINNSFIPKMILNKWGRIVHVSSAITTSFDGYSPYASAKCALEGYIKSVSKECHFLFQ